ncbi:MULTISPECIES: carbohydrate-binding module family 14 protein [Nostoc]|uniref:Chitin-binding type-2 domain-containing protein n=2 Tax=Nostoc TaxID=1177 RepID=A0ABR8IKE4_9NOSO|nr:MULTISPECIES: carbohydrate-binding module family 14 protein [Nostoc]MBD2565742.1 hypothetical protein [Nostoc linckia FACHB-391]MBD2651317.1 hypothetical protein [Nostoc foliaceum FACHB-393]
MKKLLICAFIAIVLSIGLLTTSAKIAIANADTLAVVSDYPCGPAEVDNLYPNPADPHTFYQCAPDGIKLIQCPTGLFFDVDANRCEWGSPATVETEDEA